MIVTKFDKDLRRALDGDEREIIKERQDELANLRRELRATKNGFRAQCLMQEIARRQSELVEIKSYF